MNVRIFCSTFRISLSFYSPCMIFQDVMLLLVLPSPPVSSHTSAFAAFSMPFRPAVEAIRCSLHAVHTTSSDVDCSMLPKRQTGRKLSHHLDSRPSKLAAQPVVKQAAGQMHGHKVTNMCTAYTVVRDCRCILKMCTFTNVY